MKRVVQFKHKFIILLLTLFSGLVWSQTDLTVNAIGSPYQFNGDGSVNNVTIQVNNIGPGPAGDGIQLDIDIVENTLSFQGDFMAPPWDCTAITPQSMQCLYQGNLVSGADTTVDIPVISQPGDFNLSPAMSFNVVDVGGADIDPNNNGGTLDIDYVTVGAAEINVDKFVWDGLAGSGPVTELPQNGVAEYLVYLNNTGNAPASVVDLTDVLPAGVTFDPSLNGGVNPRYYNDLIGQCAMAGATLTCTVPSIAANSVNQNLVKIFARVTGNPGDTVTNTASTTYVDGNPSNNLASASFLITAGVIPVDLEIDAFTDLNNYSTGQIFPIHVVADNLSSVDPADFVTVSTVLPDEVQFQSVAAGNIWSCSHSGESAGGTVLCDSGSNFIQGLTSYPIDINVLGIQSGANATYDASITSSTTPDLFLSNNNISNSFNVVGGFNDLSISKTASALTVNLGDAFDYQINLSHNTTPASDVNDIFIQDILPTEVSYQGYTQNSVGVVFSCTHDGSTNGGLLTCDSSDAPFGFSDSLDLSIHVEAFSDGTADNTATFTSLGDGTPANNSSTAPTVNIVIPPANVTLSKQAFLAGNPVNEIPIGSDFSYQLNVTNDNSFKVINLNVVDALPNDVTLVNYDGGTDWNCTDALVGGQTEIGCSFLGDMPVSTSSDIIINVTATNDTNVNSITNQMDVTALNLTGTLTAQSIVTITNPSLSVAIIQTPDPVDAGQQFDYEVTVTNDGNQDLNTIDVMSVLPQDFTYMSSTNSAGSCVENSGTVNCTIGSMASSDVALVTITAMAPSNPDANNNYLNMVTVQSPDLPNDVTAQLSTQVTQPPMPSYILDIYSTPNSSVAGSDSTVNVSIQNNGNVDLNPVDFQLTIDPAFTPLTVQGSDFNCQISGQAVNCIAGAVLPPGATFISSTSVQAGLTIGNFQHHVVANANGINQVDMATHEIVDINSVAPDLVISKTASISQIASNSPFEYHFNVSNLGDGEASDVSLLDTLPAGVVLNGFSGQGWQCQGSQTINCLHAGVIPVAGSAAELVFSVTAPEATGLINNQATINISNDSDLNNNIDEVTVEVVSGSAAISDVYIMKTASENELTAGENLDWTIKVRNNGPDDASQVVLSDNFPAGFVAESIMQSDGLTCMLLADSLSCEHADLAVSQELQVTISGHVNMNFEGDMLNVATVSAASIDNVDNNNQTMAQVHVLPYHLREADVAVQVNTSQTQILQGDVFQMGVTANNTGPDPAEQAVITVQVSGLIKQINNLNVAPWECQSSQSSIQCHLPESMHVGSQYELNFEVVSEQIVQTAQAIQVSAEIHSETQDPNESNNQAMSATDVRPTPTEEEMLHHMEGIMGSMDPQTERAIKNVSSYCARSYYWAMEEGMCALMFESTHEDHDDMHDMMREITPNEVLAQSDSASEIVMSQFTNIDSRLSELRGGGGGFSVAGLRGTYGNESIPLGMLAYLNAGEDDAESKNAVNDFISPWGFFINGTISMGERDKTGRELGFDFDTFGITAGLDYRLSNNKVLGVALGYANFDSEIEDEAEMQSDGVTLTGYGSFYINDNFYVDTRISYGQPNFDQSRRINFSLEDVTIDRVAKGKTSANQYSASLSMGYHFYKKAWNITPNANISYVNTSIDSFKESGAGGFNFEYGQQDIKSLRASIGLSVSRAISLEKGVITPQFDINMSREMQNDGGLIEARFINAPDDEIFWIETDEPDRTFGNAGLGLVFIGANGKQAYINYRSIFGLEGFSRGTINLGLRFEF